MNDEEPMYERRPLPPERRCGATTRKGGKCGYPAGHGTDHVGFGRCRRHGGNTPNGRRYAYQLEAIAQVPRMGGEVDVEPTDALLYCVRREAGRQAWLRTMLEIETADDAEIAEPNTRVAGFARLEVEATERLARFSKMALDAGVAERRIRMAERQAQALAHAFTTALDASAMGSRMSAQDRAELVRLYAQQLSLLEQGAGDVEGQAHERAVTPSNRH